MLRTRPIELRDANAMSNVLHSSEKSAWYTPSFQPWNAETLFLNPPYSKHDGGPVDKWIKKLISSFLCRNLPKGTFADAVSGPLSGVGIKNAILLVNATTDRSWFQLLWNFDICFLYKRIKFYNEAGSPASPTHGNVLVLLSRSPTVRQKFIDTFVPWGHIVVNTGKTK